ncbi:vitamin K epoxide reductase family protein [Myceligenerans sp. I2]|uniref:Vitamin K epoxide reductase family protein n=2 Tax=Myceligenerans indicum TaxID=2593663 RepID=A0ABS1LGY3_9MICO|nr:vitamin K epoxide reductase family protein [Myceligenerans indicum]
MLAGAVVGLIAAFVLSVDAVELAARPDATLTCDVNAVLSCGTVARAWQASVFGFPNAFLGLVAEPVVITVALAGLAGVTFPRWFMTAAQTIYLLGFLFAYWLFWESLTRIGALCPWCLTVTVSTTLVFASMLHWNILQENLYWPPRLQAHALTVVRSGAFAILVLAWLVALATVVVLKYGSALVA